MITVQESLLNLLKSCIASYPNILIKAPEDWIKEVSCREDVLPDSSQKEMQFLLIDRQHNLETGDTYTHIVKKVLPGGVEKASLIKINFNPLYEALIFHQIVIYRNGKQINSPLRGNSRVLQRELGLEECIYDGFHTLMIILSNVKIGDIIDLSYTRRGQNPVYEGKIDATEDLFFGETINKFAFRCVRSKDKSIGLKTFNISSPLKEEDLGNSQIEISYVIEDCKPLENFTVSRWRISQRLIQFSEFQSWQQVASFGKNLFSTDQKNEIHEIKELVNKWKKEGKEKKALIAAALDFVQNEIRYLGLEDGIYSHQPHPPEETLLNGYGDCKDKTFLLKVFMDEIEVISTPALVSTIYRNQVEDFLPSLNVFNHAILNVELDNHFYWLDATLKYQGGSLEDKSQLFYGSYLLLNGKNECLITNPCLLPPSELHIESSYIFHSTKCELKVKTTAKYSEADRYRSRMAFHGKEGAIQLFHDFYSAKFGSVDIKEPLSVEDDLELNEITFIENYTITDLTNFNNQFNVPLYDLPNHIPDVASISRKQPLFLDYPLKVYESFYLSSPGLHDSLNESLTLDEDSFFFNYELCQDRHGLLCKFLYETKKDHVLPEEFGKLRDAVSKIHETIGITYHYENQKKDLEISKDDEQLGKISKIFRFFRTSIFESGNYLSVLFAVMFLINIIRLLIRFFR